MSLSADQRAILELILGRGQSYADLGELLGAEETEVRERARSALAELAGADPDRNVALTDYLLGQADPIARADAVRHLREDQADHAMAGELVAKLRVLAPDASFPRLPGEPRAGRFSRRRPATSATPPGETPVGEGARGALGSLSPGQSRLLVALGAGAVLLVAVVLALTGAFGGNDDGGSEAAPAVEAQDEEVTRVALVSADGDDASGEAVFGLTGADTIYLDLALARLEPGGEDETYVVWLLLTEDRGWPLSPLPVGEDGSFEDRLAVPAGLLPLVARVRFVEITRASNQALERLLRRAPQQAQDAEDLDDFLLEVVGRRALRGAVPIEESPIEGEGQGEGG